MRIFSRLKPLCITAVAITIAGCVGTLPEPPVVLENPVAGAPVAVGAPTPTAVTPPTSRVPSTSGVPPTTGTAPVANNTSGSPANAPVDQTSTLSGSVSGSGIQVLHKANFNPFELDNGKSFTALQSLDVYRSELARHSIETPKEVDFSSQQVLVSSAGEKPTGGYNISVSTIEDLPGNVVVTVVQSIPGPSCINTAGKTHPFEFILVPSRKPIQILERQQVQDCQ